MNDSSIEIPQKVSINVFIKKRVAKNRWAYEIYFYQTGI
jgi:hypothetical protein